MATNEQNVVYALQEQKHYDVFHWVSTSSEFVAANDIADYFMVHLHSIDGWCAWLSNNNNAANIDRRETTETTGEKDEDIFAETGAFSDMQLADRGGAETLFLTLQLVHMDQPITPLMQSSHTHGDACTLNELIIFPIALRDVPLDAEVQCCVYARCGLVGRTTFHPFTASGELKTGPRRYKLLMDDAAGPRKTETPQRELLTRDLQRGLIQTVPWMDKLVEQRLEELRKKAQENSRNALPFADKTGLTLSLTFPLVRDRLPIFLLSVSREMKATVSKLRSHKATPMQPYVDMCINDENLCEAKAHVLSKSLFLVADTDAQPGPIERRQLQEIANRPLIHLDGLKVDDELLLWRFRFFITRDPAYFVPFMRCINWNNKAERQEVLKVMQLWKPISFSQALVCLSFYFCGMLYVREHAISLLDKQSDEQILHFLLQLVQGVRYDVKDELEQFLIRRMLGCWELCSTLFWYVYVEASLEKSADADKCSVVKEGRYAAFLQRISEALKETKPHFLQRIRRQQKFMGFLRLLYRSILKDPRDRTKKMEFAKSLIDMKKCGMQELFPGPLEHTGKVTDGVNAVTLPTHPCCVVDHVTSDNFYLFKSAKMPMKLSLVVQSNFCSDKSLGIIRSDQHLDPRKMATSGPGFVPLASPSPQVGIIFKIGDDVRQDQLVVQFVRRIDDMLRQDGLDLCLSPYRVLATGPTEGLVELVPDVVTLQSVQRDITGFIRSHNPTVEEYEAAMCRFTKSFAGYCVITFILGIGDRHLENILVTHDGRLLHIDFGYILGNDPKPFPPPMKINKEMVEALGGPQSERYTEFKSYCCSSYNIIRKHAQLLLSMLLLMANASIPQISGDGKLDPRVNLLKVQDKLQLGLSNPQATQYIQNVIADSVGSIFTNLWDVIHVATQATRH